MRLGFPRLIRRGPVEAHLDVGGSYVFGKFPRLIRRGPVEAYPALFIKDLVSVISAPDQARPR